ncbi:MAG: DUF4294 domain-containing protein [Flavipsychrobacter sp.]
MKQLIIGILFLLMGSYQMHAQDTLWTSRLDTVHIISARTWANDTVRYRYNQMKYYVKTILPYLNAATTTFKELDETIADNNMSKKERRVFITSKEEAVRQQFEEEVKKLNETQGVYLVKLITRQTGANIYHILREFKNPMVAIKWQAWAKLHGFNLNKKYEPQEEPWLEEIMEDLGYPLPQSYH